ncbi:hypothetical protein A8B79_03180 [Balneola sp. EhC07]|jgi:hypothetical protein|uniref:hypothetical protein n=1 Tax=Balneola sp. EhC07 TaxID=1849360 RepID=UPI0007F4490D|nr:hypothetical protein [Balneola sp. EhC07]OAN62564.1 hypothetical protein A8B79_03180 [Balneola sp. EhC07]
MTLHTLTTPAISKKSETKLFVAPLLNRIKKESKQEFVEMQQTFELMGWGELPDELKIEIYDDVRFMVQELKGYYSSCDQFVQQRRNTVHFWVSSFQDGICSLEAAIKALKVKSLA